MALISMALRAGAAQEDHEPATAASARPTPVAVLAGPHLEWPGKNDREALLYLRISVSPAGEITDVVLEKDRGFYEQRFVDAAIRSTKAMRFRAATQNGMPIATTIVQPFRFTLGESSGSGENDGWLTGISDEFRNEMRKVDALLKKGDYAGADFHAQWMLQEKVRFGYEYAVLKAELARTSASAGRSYQALRAAEDATRSTRPVLGKFTLHQPVPPNSPSNYMLPKEVVVSLLDLRMRQAAGAGMLLESLQAYYELAGLTDLPQNDPHAVIAGKIAAQLEGSEPLVAKGILESGNWYHDLFRNSFTLDKIEGTVSSLLLQCGNKVHALQYRAGVDWTVPASWDDCTVLVGGEPGTRFDFIEFPDEPPAALSQPTPEGAAAPQ